MKLKYGPVLGLFGTASMILLCFAGSQAQSKKQEAAAIRYTRNLFVSKIEKGLPRVRFDTWFRRLAGKNMKITYEVNDCGEQTGTPADRGRDFPMCVEAVAEGFDIRIDVALGVGTFKRGIVRSKPDLRGARINQEGEEHIDVNKLSDLQKKVRETGRVRRDIPTIN